MKWTFLFPVYNEERRLERGIVCAMDFLEREFDSPYEAIIVDNGSTDSTGEISRILCGRYAQLRYLSIEEKGVGAAWRAGVAKAQGNVVGYMDIDLSTDLAHLPQIERMWAADAGIDYVNGSRFAKGSQTLGRKWYRNLLSRGLLLLLKCLLGLRASDALCGFSFMKRERALELQAMSSQDRGWFYTVEMLLRAERLGWRIVDLPVRWQEDYDTTVRIGPTIGNYLTRIFQLWWQWRRPGGEG